jgi:hypothetical protein
VLVLRDIDGNGDGDGDGRFNVTCHCLGKLAAMPHEKPPFMRSAAKSDTWMTGSRTQ